MRRALLSACFLLLAHCAGTVPPGEGFQSCDAVVAGDYKDRLAPSGLRREDLNRAVRVALDAATFTTDPRLNDTVENCRTLYGFRFYTMPTDDFLAPWNGKTHIAGWTNCVYKISVIGTPTPPETWRNSSLVHEIFHIMQGCTGIPPTDEGITSPFHENWKRDGIFNAIDWAEKQP